MVRGLIEHKNVDARIDQLRQGESSLFATGKISDMFVNIVAGKEKLREKRAQLTRGRTRRRHTAQLHNDFVAIVELPGVDKVDLQIEAKENTIRISGKKTIDYEASASVHRRERVSGSFDRTFSVPIQIDPEAIRADYRDGVLMLNIPRAQSQKPRSIKIS